MCRVLVTGLLLVLLLLLLSGRSFCLLSLSLSLLDFEVEWLDLEVIISGQERVSFSDFNHFIKSFAPYFSYSTSVYLKQSAFSCHDDDISSHYFLKERFISPIDRLYFQYLIPFAIRNFFCF